MAPWSERGGGGPPHRPPADGTHHHLTPHHGHGGPPATGRYRSASRVSEIDAWDTMQNHQLQNQDSSSSDEDHLHPRRPRHTRSVSHPFPSLFFSSNSTTTTTSSSSRKKKTTTKKGSSSPTRRHMATAGRGPDESGSESGVDVDVYAPAVRGNANANANANPSLPSVRGHHRNGSSVGGSKDFAAGRCMTCGSLVRWPRELCMFRCTICMTVNDLQPPGRDARREDGQETAAAGLEEQPGPRDKTISLGYTKTLVGQCLRAFLTSALKNQAGGSAVDKEAPVAPSHLSPDYIRVPAPSTAAPVPLRPKASLYFEPRLTPGPPRSPGQHRRAPSWAGSTSRTYSTSFPEKRPMPRDLMPPGSCSRQRPPPPGPGEEANRIFKPLEDYIVRHPAPADGTDTRPRRPSEHTGTRRDVRTTSYPVPDLDPKLLLLGDFAENGTWWTGHEEVLPGRTPSGKSQNGPSTVSSRNPYIDWAELEEWYTTAIEAARPWSDIYESLVADDPALAASPAALQDIEAQIFAAQEHAQRVLLKASETILKRPGRRLTEPQDLRFLLIITSNPLLHASYKPYAGKFAPPTPSSASPRGSGPVSGRHSVIIKRIVGLLSNTPAECHNHLVAWFARYSEPAFVQTKDLVAGFLAYRLIRQNEKKYETHIDYTGGLIPSMGPSHSPAELHAALGHSQRSKKQQEKKKKVVYQEDWQIKAAAQVLGFLFAANNMGHARRGGLASRRPDSSPGNRRRELVQSPGQILATSDFYVTLLDDSDLVADFEAWERKQGRFSFCQHPFLLSIGAKIQILEHDARRQMENKARDAFFDSIMTNRVVQQFLVLNIRRECLVDDSLKAVSEVIGGGGEDIKKGLRIIFKGEEGVDAGGLRKEWFLLLVREVFNPDHGMFLYDEDSNYCYFNPNSLEPSEQFFLVGVVLGLAIYNSTILDVPLPPFAFRKLLAAAPPPSNTSPLHPHPHPRQQQPMTYTLDDLAEYRPRLAHGLRQLLDYEDDDVESTFALTFSLDTTRYGSAPESVPLCPAGDRRPVTNANRREYVDAYVRHQLDTAVARQFEPFKRGFYTVCGSSSGGGSGGALSLFRPEEIELLVRGSSGYADQPLDVASLKAVAQYENWPAAGDPAEEEETVKWFWEAFEGAEPQAQRRLLAFITGSDRVPALGAASLGIRVSCLGEECGRFPTARTCFNSVGLWRARDKGKFVRVLWRAVGESEGFGLK